MKRYVKGIIFAYDPLFNFDYFDPYRLDILFVRRNERPYKGKLDLPGGHVEPGETSEEALARELEEELGIGGPMFFFQSRRRKHKGEDALVDFFAGYSDKVVTLSHKGYSRGYQDPGELMQVPYLLRRTRNIRLSQIAFPSNRDVLSEFGTMIEHDMASRLRNDRDYRGEQIHHTPNLFMPERVSVRKYHILRR